eukprot:scaffold2795_cov106-Isochrysis_galbana.AAC.6
MLASSLCRPRSSGAITLSRSGSSAGGEACALSVCVWASHITCVSARRGVPLGKGGDRLTAGASSDCSVDSFCTLPPPELSLGEEEKHGARDGTKDDRIGGGLGNTAVCSSCLRKRTSRRVLRPRATASSLVAAFCCDNSTSLSAASGWKLSHLAISLNAVATVADRIADHSASVRCPSSSSESSSITGMRSSSNAWYFCLRRDEPSDGSSPLMAARITLLSIGCSALFTSTSSFRQDAITLACRALPERSSGLAVAS